MRFVRTVLVISLVVALGAGITACGRGDGIAARVNGEAIPKSEVDEQIERLVEAYPTMFEGEAGEQRLLEYRQRILENLIDNLLVKQAAEDRGIDVAEADVDEEVEKLKAGYPEEAQFEEAIASSGMTMDQLRDQLREQLLNQRIVEELTREAATPDEAEIEEYYQSNIVQFSEAAGKRAAHILIDTVDRAVAEDVLERVRAGEEFEDLARQYSVDTATASRGGDLGWPTQAYTAEFQDALDSLSPGEVSGLVETEFGLHIIKVTDEREDRQKPLDEVREQIERILLQQRRADLYSSFLEQLRAEATIEILDPELTGADAADGDEDPADGDEGPAGDGASDDD